MRLRTIAEFRLHSNGEVGSKTVLKERIEEKRKNSSGRDYSTILNKEPTALIVSSKAGQVKWSQSENINFSVEVWSLFKQIACNLIRLQL